MFAVLSLVSCFISVFIAALLLSPFVGEQPCGCWLLSENRYLALPTPRALGAVPDLFSGKDLAKITLASSWGRSQSLTFLLLVELLPAGGQMCREELGKARVELQGGEELPADPSSGWDGGAGQQLAQGPGPCRVRTARIVLLLQGEEQRAEPS